MIKVLVATASRHGATREIGEQLGAQISAGLNAHGMDAEVHVRDAATVDDLTPYDALVLGSAVYMGRWLKSARKFVDREEEHLGAMPVWLFSSGPVIPDDEPSPKSPWSTVEWAKDHHTFGGKLDRTVLSRTERLVASAVRAADGDNRSPSEIAEWAREISESLATTLAH